MLRVFFAMCVGRFGFERGRISAKRPATGNR